MSNNANSTIGISAAGTTQQTATPIWQYSFYNQISTCTATAKGVVLPGLNGNTTAGGGSTLGNSSAAILNTPYVIRNDGNVACNVYPPYGVLVGAAALVAIGNLGVGIPYSLASGSAASFTAISSTQWEVAAVSYVTKPVVEVDASTTLTAAQSGSIIAFTVAAANITITLPLPAAGLNYLFICAAQAGTNTMTIATNGAANIFFGTALNLSTGIATIVTHHNVTQATAGVVGDWCEVNSDGTNWYVRAQSYTAAVWGSAA